VSIAGMGVTTCRQGREGVYVLPDNQKSPLPLSLIFCVAYSVYLSLL
jgi:hypothetical protein